MRRYVIAAAALLPLLGGGCVAKTAWDVATLPVKAGSKAIDLATTSQDESDRNYGRKMRKQEEREGKERKKREKACRKDPSRCEPGDRSDRSDDRYR